ncbi:MAG: hypothetical protein VB108_11550 [Anaerolineaceae bacterium]|nr:hypothetical protein [Anaerolineaceae bacterium]
MHDKRIIATWEQTPGSPYPGLRFTFEEGGKFHAEYEPMSIHSGGTWSIEDDKMDMDQTEHTFGLVGKFFGRYEIDGNLLKMNLVSGEDKPRPENLDGAVVYMRVEE